MTDRITVAYGDGIGPEIMKATMRVLDAAGADLEYDIITVGKPVYLSGVTSGISDDSWATLRKNGVFLKAPITTPQGGGYKSLNVTIRKTLGLFANIRPCKAYAPYVHSHFPTMDLVVVRENEEDLYAGIEHRQTNEVVQSLKLISKSGSERICRYAFEYARANKRKRVTCMTKDNIMKLTDGTFHATFDRIAAEYPDIENDHYIIDIGSARLADSPQNFDVIVTLNLYGDIVSDITAQVAGSVGLCGSSNIGKDFAMFEAIHGSAPDIAGKGIANPSGLINGACMMLNHLGKGDIAQKIQNALLCTIENGIHTGDIYSEETSSRRVNTQEFTDALIERLGNKPKQLVPFANNPDAKPIVIEDPKVKQQTKALVGTDLYLDWSGNDSKELGDKIKAASTDALPLRLITNRGIQVYPNVHAEITTTDHWRCRFKSSDESSVSTKDVAELITSITDAGLEIIKMDNLYTFDGERGYSLCQGE